MCGDTPFKRIFEHMNDENRLDEIIARYLAGVSTPEESAFIAHWFRHAGNINKPDITLSQVDKRRILKKMHAEIEGPAQKKVPFVWYAAAMLTGLLLGGWGIRYLLSPAPKVYITIHTGIGEVRHTWLPDSTEIWINANTTLRYHPDFRHHREVLLMGEALFSVKQDKEHEFLVTTPDSVSTHVLGTRFNIGSYRTDHHTTISVLSGKVKIEKTGTQLGTLTARQSLMFRQNAQTFTRSMIADTTSAMGWTNGSWVYENIDAAELARLLYNQYGITLNNKTGHSLQSKTGINFNHHQTAAEITEIFCALANCRYHMVDEKLFELY
jgi:transmembrane sensor